MQPYQQQRRHFNGLAVEDGGHHLAAALLYLFSVVVRTLPGCQNIVHDDYLLTLYIARNAVVTREDAFLAALGTMQALAFPEYFHIVKS